VSTSLTKLGDKARPAIPELSAVLNNAGTPGAVRTDVAKSLGKIGARKSAEALIEVRVNVGTATAIRIAAVEAVSGMGRAGKVALRELMRLSQTAGTGKDVRKAAIEAIAAIEAADRGDELMPVERKYDMMVRVGDRGRTLSSLHPQGFVRISGKRRDARSERDIIEPETEVVVIGGDLQGLIVRPAASVQVVEHLPGYGQSVHSSFGELLARQEQLEVIQQEDWQARLPQWRLVAPTAYGWVSFWGHSSPPPVWGSLGIQ
jgi:HEAT repeat protein